MKSTNRGFTLIEVLVASAVLLLILGFLLTTVSQTSRVWRHSSDTIEAFQSAREAFDLITRKLSSATLNTYWDYQYKEVPGIGSYPSGYRRESDLHFQTGPGLAGDSHTAFFQTFDGYTQDPADYGGMTQLLNDCGFYVLYSGDGSWRPPTASGMPETYRHRLMQFTKPTEDMEWDHDTEQGHEMGQPGDANFAEANTPIGENVIAIAFLPKHFTANGSEAFGGGFSYDSRQGADNDPQPATANQLPPLIEVVLVAIDAQSAKRLDTGSTPPAEITAALSGRLQSPGQLDNDLQGIQNDLAEKGITARIFRATVPIQASRWSES